MVESCVDTRTYFELGEKETCPLSKVNEIIIFEENLGAHQTVLLSFMIVLKHWPEDAFHMRLLGSFKHQQ